MWADREAAEAGLKRSVWLAEFLQRQRDASPARGVEVAEERVLVTHLTVDDLIGPPATEANLENLENLGEPEVTPEDPAEHDGLLADAEVGCEHPRADRISLGYAVRCGVCGEMLR